VPDGMPGLVTFGLCTSAFRHDILPPMTTDPERRRNRHFLVAGYVTCLAVAVAAEQSIVSAHDYLGKVHPGPAWIACFAIFVAAMSLVVLIGNRLVRPVPALLLVLQTAAVVTMARIDGNSATAGLLVLIAWQVAMITSAFRAFVYASAQSLLVLIAFREAWPVPEYCVFVASFVALQGFAIAAADALKIQALTAKQLEDALTELRSTQALLADAARQTERAHISRELHDSWGHELTALCLQLEIAAHLAAPGALADRVRQARAIAASLIGQLRDVVGSLRTATGLDLKARLERLTRGIERPKVHLALDANNDAVLVSVDQAHAILRCAQEAITNAVRHSDAGNLWMELTVTDADARLVISDDGKGIPAGPVRAGLGIVGMRERIAALGGRIEFTTGRGRGFTIEAQVPRAAL